MYIYTSCHTTDMDDKKYTGKLASSYNYLRHALNTKDASHRCVKSQSSIIKSQRFITPSPLFVANLLPSAFSYAHTAALSTSTSSEGR